MTTFEIGKAYEMRFITDSDLRVKWTLIARTAKFATFQRENTSETMRRKIKIYNDEEHVVDGSYSMAPSINARHKAA